MIDLEMIKVNINFKMIIFKLLSGYLFILKYECKYKKVLIFKFFLFESIKDDRFFIKFIFRI